MTVPFSPSSPNEIAALVGWWELAGVTHDFASDPVPWLVDPEEDLEETPEHKPQAVASAKTQPVAKPVEAIIPIGADRAAWPTSFEALPAWLASLDGLIDGDSRPAVPPRGKSGAALMILVAEPEEGDSDRLLSGPQGAVLAGFARAAGLDESEIYFASVLPQHLPHADWGNLQRRNAGAILTHHIALAAPKRLLIAGPHILPLIGHDTAQGAAALREFNHEGGSVPAMAARDPASLLRRGEVRARFWRRWLEWTKET